VGDGVEKHLWVGLCQTVRTFFEKFGGNLGKKMFEKFGETAEKNLKMFEKLQIWEWQASIY
jgi:hypothetical protein